MHTVIKRQSFFLSVSKRRCELAAIKSELLQSQIVVLYPKSITDYSLSTCSNLCFGLCVKVFFILLKMSLAYITKQDVQKIGLCEEDTRSLLGE